MPQSEASLYSTVSLTRLRTFMVKLNGVECQILEPIMQPCTMEGNCVQYSNLVTCKPESATVIVKR